MYGHESYQELVACIKLIRWQGYSLRNKYKALKKLGSFSSALDLQSDEWEKLLNQRMNRRQLPAQCNIDLDLAWLENSENHFISIFDEYYPDSLKTLSDPPLGLFVQGDFRVLSTVQFAIVGSRSQTPAGKKISAQFAHDLSVLGITITSGLAIGIDSSAHNAVCKARGKTVAVLGCGLDRIYPRQNIQLAKMITESGCLISEFSIGTPPRKENFPARNRVIAGLSEGVLVVEAAKRSGSLITARLALEQGKEVFAVPSSILSPQSSGCHSLLKQGAVLTESVDDILFELQLPLKAKCFDADDQEKQLIRHDNDCRVLAAIDFEATSVDQIMQRIDIGFDAVLSRLLELELEGLIERAHNGDYYRLT